MKRSGDETATLLVQTVAVGARNKVEDLTLLNGGTSRMKIVDHIEEKYYLK